jgi:hypothetical protein
MQRILEIIKEIRHRYPDDGFFKDFESSVEENELKREYYHVYENTLTTIDHNAWCFFKEKVVKNFLSNQRDGQQKQGFFHLLNESFAYKYLKLKGYINIEFLPELPKKKQKQPDLRFQIQEEIGFCEVKSIGISNDEIARRACTSFEYKDRSIYYNLSPEFMRQLDDNINKAKLKIPPGNKGMIYILITFDDFTHSCISYYRSQLEEFVSDHASDTLILQLGLFGDTICTQSCKAINLN